MTRRRRLGLALVVFGVISLTLGLTAPAVTAEAPSQTAWWFELQTKTLPAPLPSPPNVPAGGLYVQQGPNGPVAYGAVRYAASSAASATLTLAAAPGSTTSLGAPVQACVTNSSWKAPPAPPGAWEDRASYEKPCAPGKISSDGTVVAFFLDSSYFKANALDVAIVPVDGSSPFAIAFDKPAADSLKLETKPSGGLSPAPPPVTAGAPSGGGSSRPSTVTAAPAATPVATTPAATAPAGDDRSSIANNVLKVAGLGDPDRGERMAALSGASALVIGWWLLSTRATRVPQLLGSLGGGGDAEAATSRVGGVGRFSRTRDTDARSLR